VSAYFVTATGTGIGKTFVTRGLIRALRANDRHAEALKPIMSGYEPSEAAGSDAGLLLAAARRPVSEESISLISPWRFAAPLAPDMAAAREGRTIDFDDLIPFCQAAVRSIRGVLLIEGAGGVMSPINADRTVLDWIGRLELPVILVAGSYLGMISHTLSALDAIARRGLVVKAVVISETPGSPVRLDETRDTIARFAPQSDVVALPRSTPSVPEHPVFDRIAARL